MPSELRASLVSAMGIFVGIVSAVSLFGLGSLLQITGFKGAFAIATLFGLLAAVFFVLASKTHKQAGEDASRSLGI